MVHMNSREGLINAASSDPYDNRHLTIFSGHFLCSILLYVYHLNKNIMCCHLHSNTHHLLCCHDHLPER